MNKPDAFLKKSQATLPDFRTWAENIVLLAQTYGTAREEIEKALEQACNYGDARGYERGINQGWAIEQDKNHKHESDGSIYCSNPPQNKCKICGDFYRGAIEQEGDITHRTKSKFELGYRGKK